MDAAGLPSGLARDHLENLIATDLAVRTGMRLDSPDEAIFTRSTASISLDVSAQITLPQCGARTAETSPVPAP